MEKPEKPLPGDCCETGCSICVYDLYTDRMKKYKKWVRQQEAGGKKDNGNGKKE
jgi:hypothetical protein